MVKKLLDLATDASLTINQKPRLLIYRYDPSPASGGFGATILSRPSPAATTRSSARTRTIRSAAALSRSPSRRVSVRLEVEGEWVMAIGDGYFFALAFRHRRSAFSLSRPNQTTVKP